ncbi:MAG: carbohydrate-binding family 9-like protein [Armatimonadetes bacterium]|nr:carbohydrate-binding family 9-like protein [Armatimonadota bacterium]MDW8121370.1 carbohydrate-binding family 9-like protein [Armatimonadota bacterium]
MFLPTFLLTSLLGTIPGTPFKIVPLAPYCVVGPVLDWNDPHSFAGLPFGEKWLYGVPFYLIDPRLNRGRGFVRNREIPINEPATYLFGLVAAREKLPIAVINFADGTQMERPLTDLFPAIRAHPPLYRWRLDLFYVTVHRKEKPQKVSTVFIKGADLFALTVTSSSPASLDSLINRLKAQQQRWKEEQREMEKLESLATLLKDMGQVAILPAVPPSSPLSHPLVSYLVKTGLTTNWTLLTPQQLIDEDFFNASRFPIALYLTGEQFFYSIKRERDAIKALRNYLRDGGFLIVLPTQPFPFYYDEKGRVVGNALEVGLPVSGGWEGPPEGVNLVFEKTAQPDPAFELPDRFPFPRSGDLRWRPVYPPSGEPVDFTYLPVWTLKDDQGKSYGDAIAFLQYHKGPLAPGRFLYVWHRLWSDNLLPLLARSILHFAAKQVSEKPPLKKSLILRTTEPVAVDGVLNESIWKQTPALLLSDIRGRPYPRTIARLTWDSSYLYIAFECEDDDIWATKTQRDDFLWEEEVVEAFIDPDGDGLNYFEFQINPLNTQIDLIIPDPVEGVKDAKKNALWNCEGFLSAVHVRGTVNKRDDKDDGWTVEMAIPFKSLGIETPRTGNEWRLNLYRIDRPKGSENDPLLLAWSRCQRWFHEPERFARVLFAGNPYNEDFRSYQEGAEPYPTWKVTEGKWQVRSGQLIGEDSGTDGWIASGIQTGFGDWSDYEVEIRFRVLEYGSDWRDGFWVAFRHQDPSNSYSLNLYGPKMKRVQLHKISNGVSTNDDNPLVDTSWVADQEEHRLLIRLKGPELHATLDGTEIFRIKDENLAGGPPIPSGMVVLSARRWSGSQGHTRVAISQFRVTPLAPIE